MDRLVVDLLPLFSLFLSPSVTVYLPSYLPRCPSPKSYHWKLLPKSWNQGKNATGKKKQFAREHVPNPQFAIFHHPKKTKTKQKQMPCLFPHSFVKENWEICNFWIPHMFPGGPIQGLGSNLFFLFFHFWLCLFVFLFFPGFLIFHVGLFQICFFWFFVF